MIHVQSNFISYLQNLQALLEAGKKVYATCDVQGKRIYAEVTGKDGVLYLHALEKATHFPNGAISVSVSLNFSL